MRLLSPQSCTSAYTGFNSRTPGGVRRVVDCRHPSGCRVSIHAPREGCDSSEERRAVRRRSFNSRTPGGVRRRRGAKGRGCHDVSIHAPREGCDRILLYHICERLRFNSRTPGGVRRPMRDRRYIVQDVSIHAPREGCDLQLNLSHIDSLISFNSRTPGGVRPLIVIIYCKRTEFQFTHPGRGATKMGLLVWVSSLVSIHAPREGCDLFQPTSYSSAKRFNSRTPGGVRLVSTSI